MQDLRRSLGSQSRRIAHTSTAGGKLPTLAGVENDAAAMPAGAQAAAAAAAERSWRSTSRTVTDTITGEDTVACNSCE